jgi:Tol biopolymer transport system component
VLPVDDTEKATEIASGTAFNYGLNWTRKGKIVFSSMVQDRLHISRIDPDGSNRVQLTTVGDNYSPVSSTDGNSIVFASNRNGPFNIWRMNADDGSEPTQLTFGDGSYYPSVSPDNQWVAYDDLTDSGVSIWKVPMSGGDIVKVIEKYRMAVFSPDSQLIAGRYHVESGTTDVAIFSAEGGEPLMRFIVPIQEWQRLEWLPNQRELSYIKDSNIFTYNRDTGTSKQITKFNSDQIYAYAWSPDYKQVACQRGTTINDVTMITLP